MDEAGWLIILACGFCALLGIQLGALFGKGSQGGRITEGFSAGIQEIQTAPKVTSVEVGDDDVLLFESLAIDSGDQWKPLREFLENSIVGRYPKDLEGKPRRRAYFFPPGTLNVLHIKRRASAESAALSSIATGTAPQ